ncbi:MAG: 50S ribosomal protein L15 [Patescibacteria group bacterium]
MIELHNLKPARGARKKTDRIGRGNASGHGTTAGKGTKGQRARSGGRNKLKLKGMKQMLLSFPKSRGFRSGVPQSYTITLGRLSAAYSAATIIDLKSLKKAKLIPKSAQRAKVVMGGDAPKTALNLIDIAVTAQAKKAIEKAGGTVKTANIKSKTSK